MKFKITWTVDGGAGGDIGGEESVAVGAIGGTRLTNVVVHRRRSDSGDRPP
ncbi:TPR-like protein [Sesbania bispinosa]|nr:TPR-like protein [Sesbania bispinosa]